MRILKPRLALASATAILAVAVWCVLNPGGRFGLSRFGLTTYNRVPLPLVDVQVSADGTVRWVKKSHQIDGAALEQLYAGDPDAVIIAVGWESAARMSGEVTPVQRKKLWILPTGEALALYNKLKGWGTRVAIHVHSTC